MRWEEDGFAVLRFLAGRWSENLTRWLDAAAASGGRIVAVDYAELVERTQPLVEGLFARLGIEVPAARIAQGIEWARGATRPDGGFYWRGRPGAYREFLTPAQVERYFARYEPAWRHHGIAFAR